MSIFPQRALRRFVLDGDGDGHEVGEERAEGREEQGREEHRASIVVIGGKEHAESRLRRGEALREGVMEPVWIGVHHPVTNLEIHGSVLIAAKEFWIEHLVSRLHTKRAAQFTG